MAGDNSTDGPVTSPSQVDDSASSAQPSAPQPDQSQDPASIGLVPNDITGAPAPVIPASVSYKGSTPHGQAAAAGVFGQADRAVADFQQQDHDRELADREQARMDSVGAQRAMQGEVDATHDYIDRDRVLESKLVDLNKGFANVEAQANAEAQASRARYLTDYETQLSAVRQLATQSGNPYAHMSFGQAAGLGFAQFAEGFLAARGIHINVSDQINTWVNRAIEEHQQQIRNAREGANDSLHLYEIARQTSQDDWEARQRYRGFVIAGLQTQIQANASQFQSQIALAHAKEGVAKLQIEADATQRAIGDMHYQRLREMMQTEIDRAYKQGMLSVEQYKAETERLKANAAQPKNMLVPLTDPEAGPNGGHRVIGWLDPNNKKGMEDTLQKRAFTQDVYAKADALQKAYERAGLNNVDISDASKMLWKMRSPEYRQYQAARTDLLNTLVYANSGKQINESEFERYKQLVPDESFWQKGNNRWSLPAMREQVRKDLTSLRDTYDVRAASGAPMEQISPGVKADYDALMAGQKPVETQTSADVKTATGDVREAHGEASQLFARFAEEQRNAGKEGGEQYTGEGQRQMMLQPDAAVGIDHLVTAVVEPAKLRKMAEAGIVGQITGDDKRLSADSRETLNDIASGKIKASEVVRDYAKHVVELLDKDPAAVKKLLERVGNE